MSHGLLLPRLEQDIFRSWTPCLGISHNTIAHTRTYWWQHAILATGGHDKHILPAIVLLNKTKLAMCWNSVHGSSKSLRLLMSSGKLYGWKLWMLCGSAFL
jgi:hypothetical protein